ncbi:MAG TPA: O-antigen ligase family protein [Verrucomicrobiae bacterium]|nr:O-antigen ligase family protein [Verrucomicrobiae bacterium]
MTTSSTARLRLWMDNPNETGAFLALLIVALLAVACHTVKKALNVKGPGRDMGGTAACSLTSIGGPRFRAALLAWSSLAIALTLAWALATTQSRGALAALGAGLLSLGLAWRRLPLLRWLPIAIFGMSSAIFAIGPGGSRIARAATGTDRSVITRTEVYSAIPRMAAAAPFGWGLGHAGEAYADWFQSPRERHNFKHLLGSHATLLVEVGWLPAILTAALCCVALAACFSRHRAQNSGSGVPALSQGPDASTAPPVMAPLASCLACPQAAGAMLVTFLVAGAVNHVALDPFVCALGILPALMSLARTDLHLSRPALAFAASLGAAFPACAIAIGFLRTGRPPIHRSLDGSVSLGDRGAHTLTLAHPDPRVTGSAPGRELRAALATLAQQDSATRDVGRLMLKADCWTSLRVLPPDPASPPTSIPALLLTGRAEGMTAEWLRAANRIVWINPPSPDAIPPDLARALREVADDKRLSILAGELLGPDYFNAWRGAMGPANHSCLTSWPGRGQLVPDFPRRALLLAADTSPERITQLLSSKDNTGQLKQ